MPELKMLENVLKPKETPKVHVRKHFSREIGSNRAKKGHVVLESTIFFRSLPVVNALKCPITSNNFMGNLSLKKIAEVARPI